MSPQTVDASAELSELLSRARKLEGRIVELQTTIATLRHDFKHAVRAEQCEVAPDAIEPAKHLS